MAVSYLININNDHHILSMIHEINHDPSDYRSSNRCVFADRKRATNEVKRSYATAWKTTKNITFDLFVMNGDEGECKYCVENHHRKSRND